MSGRSGFDPGTGAVTAQWLADEALDADAAPLTTEEVTLDPDGAAGWDAVRALGHRMVDDMLDQLRGVRGGPVWRSVPDSARAALDAPLPDASSDPADVYDAFVEHVLPYPTGNIHPRFWGWVMGTGSPTGMLSMMLEGAMNVNAFAGDQGAVFVERQVVAWLKEMLGYAPEASGVLVSGGSMANFVGIAAARRALAGIDFDGLGLADVDAAPMLYCSAETHNSVFKSAALLGLGRAAVRKIRVHDDYTLDVDALEREIADDLALGRRPFCVVANAGTVNTGAIDDLARIADVCARYGLWLHVDGAFGAVAALAPALRDRLDGLTRADSIAVDLHKWLHMPYDVGCALVREPAAHRAAFAQQASYLARQTRGLAAETTTFSDLGPQLSRGFRALRAWMELKTHGVARYAQLVEQNVAQAQYLAGLVDASPNFVLAAPVPLNIVCFRGVVPGLDDDALDALNRDLLAELQERGVAVPSSTVLGGRYVIRVAICNHRSKRADFDLMMQVLEEILAERMRKA